MDVSFISLGNFTKSQSITLIFTDASGTSFFLAEHSKGDE